MSSMCEAVVPSLLGDTLKRASIDDQSFTLFDYKVLLLLSIHLYSNRVTGVYELAMRRSAEALSPGKPDHEAITPAGLACLL